MSNRKFGDYCHVAAGKGLGVLIEIPVICFSVKIIAKAVGKR
jgi:hypothetical protein